MRRPKLLLAALLLSLLALMSAKSWLVEPPPLRTSSNPGEFDAKRAKQRLAYILGDQRPHAADTVANDAVRARLMATLQRMGFQPVVRDQLACNELYKRRGVSCARVRNVIAVVGSGPGKAVLLNAHYDSVPVGPGASDDGIGVATLLEVAANLKSRPPDRPVIFLFNEGEELGLVGARAFLADPLSRDVGSLINLEARGVRGPAIMFETSRPNATAVSLFAAHVERPVANSLSADVYRLLPNYTDVNSFAERGWLTFNLAPIGNETRYHSAGDDLASLNLATLQHMGDQTLALTRALVNRPAAAVGGNRVYMDLGGRTLISLPLAAGALLIAALLTIFAILALREGRLASSLGVTLGTLAGSAASTWLVITLIGAARHGMFWRAAPAWTHLAISTVTILTGLVLVATLGRSATVRQLRMSFWLVYLTLGAMIGLFAPGGIIFFLFPPLITLAGIAGYRWWPPAQRVGGVLAIIAVYVTWGALLGVLEELLDQGPMWIFAPLTALVVMPILIECKPLIEAVRPRSGAAIAGALALGATAAAAAAPAYSADRQQLFVIQHVTDASSGKSWWSIINDGAPVPQAGRWERSKLPLNDRQRWLSEAPVNPAAKAPSIQIVSQNRSADERTLTLRLSANGNERIELIAPEDAKIRSAGFQGLVRPIDANEDGKYFINCFGRSCDGATLILTTDQPKPIEFLVVGSGMPLPPSAARLVAARPKFARPQYNRDESIAFTRVNL